MKNTDAVRRRRLATYWVVGTVLPVLYLWARGGSWTSSETFHTVLEVSATLIALFVAVLALVRFYSKKSNTILFIGTGFLGTGLLDGYHAAVTSAYFKSLMPSDLGSLIPWSWIASRQFLALMLFLAWVGWRREKNVGASGRIPEAWVYAIAATLTGVSFLFFAFVPLPPAYYPGFFHRPEEFGPALLLGLALWGFLSKGKWVHDSLEHWLIVSLVVGLVAQAVYMPFSAELYDLEFDAAHVLKIVSYLCVLTGLAMGTYETFHAVEKGRVRIKEHTLALAVANQELEAFSYSVSHDLRGSLRTMSGFAYALREDYGATLDEKALDYIDRISRASSRMSDLIEGLLSLSQAARGEILVERVDLTELSNSIAGELADREPGHVVSITVAPGLVADGDPRLLRVLLRNLLANAWKFTRDVADPQVEVGVKRDAGSEVFYVRDNGAGFDMAHADALFTPFERLHSEEEFEGTGVGLATVARVVRRHGGDVWGEGVVGGGASIYFTLVERERPSD